MPIQGNKRFNISSEVSSVLPQHISNESPDLEVFLQKYLEFLETDNSASYYLNTINNNRDIDETDDTFLSRLQNEIGQPIPRQFPTDPRLLYKHLTELYKSRGTMDSIKAFFRFFYDDEVEIYFPKDDMFAPSDGKWFSQTDDIIANPLAYTPAYTYTISTVTSLLDFDDDNGSKLSFETPLIYINGTVVTTYTTSVKPNVANSNLDYFIQFDTPLAVNDVVTIHNTGNFNTEDGFLSSSKKIQDSYYYQKFSYVLRTGSNAPLWKNSFNRLIHPAGFIFFGEILILIYLQSILSLNQPGRQVGGLPIPVVIPLTQAKSYFNKLNTRTNDWNSYVVKSYEFQHHHLVFGMREYFERFKFKLISPISMWSSTTFADVAAKKTDGNIETKIYQSTAGGPAHEYTVTPPNAVGTIPPVIIGTSQYLPYI